MRRLSACFSFLSLIFFVSFLSACSQQKLTDFDKTQPEFSLIDFFEGDSLAYGIFEDRFGTLQRRFKVNISGQKTQEEIAGMEVEGEAGAGLVKVTMTGRHDVKRIQIDPSLMDDDKEMLEDLIAAAMNDATRKVEEVTQSKMSAVGGGLGLPPGMKLPF